MPRPAQGIEIVEEDGVRVLQIGGNAIQSAMRLDAPDRIELDYVRAMMAFLLFRPNPRDVLLVAWAEARWRASSTSACQKTRVSVVEIDPGVGHRGAQILPLSRRGRAAGNSDRRRGPGRAAAPRELRRARRSMGSSTDVRRRACARHPSTTAP